MRSMLNIKHVENILTMQFQTLNVAKTYRKRYNKSNPEKQSRIILSAKRE